MVHHRAAKIARDKCPYAHPLCSGNYKSVFIIIAFNNKVQITRQIVFNSWNALHYNAPEIPIADSNAINCNAPQIPIVDSNRFRACLGKINAILVL